MHYLIYKISNKLDNKIYVGKHKTKNKDDDYFGSGLLLERAVEKHGRENFVKEIIMELPSEEAVNQKEAEIVDEEFIARLDTYNIMLGGQGGFDYINENNLGHTDTWLNAIRSEKNKERAREKQKLVLAINSEQKRKMENGHRLHVSIYGNGWEGRKHQDVSKRKISATMKKIRSGKNNPSYGTCWVTNGILNKKIKNTESIENGWRRGRV